MPSHLPHSKDFAVRMILASLAIFVTTEVLRVFQLWLTQVENVPLRAFTIGFLLPLAWITRVNGRLIGLFSLLLCAILSVALLMPPYGFRMESLSDGAALVFLIITGILLVQSIATAQTNKSLHRKAQIRAEQEHVLAQIARLARSSTDPSAIRTEAAKLVAQLLKADRCFFGVFDEDESRISDEWRREGLPALVNIPVLSDYKTVLREYEVSGKPVIIRDVHTDPISICVSDLFDTLLIRSIIRMPVLSNGKVVAVLCVAMAESPRDWTASETAFLEVVAAETRAAVETAHAFLREKTIATTLQRLLLPEPSLHTSGLDVAIFYKAALDEANIGGDFADAFVIDHGRSALVLGDVSGKGLQAATQIAVVLNMLRYVLYQTDLLSVSITRLNNTLAAHRLLDGFVSLFVGVYDPQSETLTYVSCGHEPTLVCRKTGEIEHLMPTGMVLGVLASMEYRQVSIPFSHEDALLIYTDGVSEAGPNRQTQLGIAGLSRLLLSAIPFTSANQIVKYVSDGVHTASQGRSHDDVCILAAVLTTIPR